MSTNASDSNLINLIKDLSDYTKTRGFGWGPSNYKFVYKLLPLPNESRVTKIFVLSSIAKLFDSLGLLSPIIIRSKILMQELWLHKSDWDQPLSKNLLDTWVGLHKQHNHAV